MTQRLSGLALPFRVTGGRVERFERRYGKRKAPESTA